MDEQSGTCGDRVAVRPVQVCGREPVSCLWGCGGCEKKEESLKKKRLQKSQHNKFKLIQRECGTGIFQVG